MARPRKPKAAARRKPPPSSSSKGKGGGEGGGGGRALVLVLGDVGRSPRMQYHALSLAEQAGMEVDVVGYGGAQPHERVAGHPRIRVRELSPFPWALPRGVLFVLLAPFKVAFQLAGLMWTLLFLVARPDVILVQNPPAIPTLLVVRVVAALRRSRLVIDWHNYGFTLLGMSLGPRHPLTRVAYWYERVLGRGADGNLCVTGAMRDNLRDEWGVEATTLYDRAPEFFRRLAPAERHELFARLGRVGGPLHGVWGCGRDGDDSRSTLFTEVSPGGGVRMRDDRPALVVSSTSWTVDEDFGTLLDAIAEVDRRASRSRAFPRVLFVITGKGPQREHYERRIAGMSLERTAVVTAFLAAEDYPRLLGSADLGVSLHTSSSGLDLPMKVVDMFGCGLPVCAVGFSCLAELVRHGENGLVFRDSPELAAQMARLLARFPAATPELDAMREAVGEFQKVRWAEGWAGAAQPLCAP